jgi:hypothetical protein
MIAHSVAHEEVPMNDVRRVRTLKAMPTGLAAFLLFVLGATTALAADSKTSPASACTATDPATGLPITTGAAHKAGGAIENSNASHADVNLGCPVVRDNTTNVTGLDGFKVYVYATSAAELIDCWLYSARDDIGGNSLVESDQRQSSGTGVQTLDWTTSSTTSEDPGFYNLICTLPRNLDRLIGYWWDEP